MLGKYIYHCEDSLTASVFSHLLHLPVEVFWALLRSACHSSELPASVGEPETVQFLPSWDPTGTQNEARVIPDLFIRFPEIDLIIEAKRWDIPMQDPEQWKRELIAYDNEYGKEDRQVLFVAIGGLLSHENRELLVRDRKHTVHMCSWNALLNTCQNKIAEHEHLLPTSSYVSAQVRILKHLVELFGWHDFRVIHWFDLKAFESYLLPSSTEEHQSLFNNLREQILTYE
jgi:hypothetical protein